MKKITSLFLITALIAALIGCAMPGAANDEQQTDASFSAEGKTFSQTEDAQAVAKSIYAGANVKLVSAMSAVGSYNGPYQEASFTVLVKNLAYDKNVLIHLTADGTKWVDIKARYLGPAENGYELWKAYYSGQFGSTADLRFAVKYEAAGQTYWDNNNGQDFRIGKNAGVMLKEINLLNYTTRDQYYLYNNQLYLEVDVAVANLGYTKNVKIIYTTDNWQTQGTVNAAFAPYWSPVRGSIASPNVYNVEMWRVNSYINGVNNNATEITYYIAYTVNGITYYDNNFGQNYKAQIMR